MNDFGLSDEQLFPLLTEQSAATLRRLREHPHAPKYNWKTGDRLTQPMLDNVRRFADSLRHSLAPSRREWLIPFLQHCRSHVPFYRSQENWPSEIASLESLPLLTRDELRASPWAFVPDDQSVNDLIVYTTSGTTGSRLQIPATPELPTRYLPLIEYALQQIGIELQRDRPLAIVQVCAQRGTVVHCGVNAYLNGAGYAKINLDPADWNNPAHAVEFLNDANPNLLTGDPFSLWRLMQLPVKLNPQAIVSSAMTLSNGLRDTLADRFNCPVIDLYSMNETGPIAWSSEHGIFKIFPHQIVVELIKDAKPQSAGEIVVTGGFNSCLPLVRYRTGDYAEFDQLGQFTRLHARSPIAFLSDSGEWFSSADLNTELSRSLFPWISVHQRCNGGVVVTTADSPDDLGECLNAVRRHFGKSCLIEHVRINDTLRHGKPTRFSSELSHPLIGEATSTDPSNSPAVAQDSSRQSL